MDTFDDDFKLDPLSDLDCLRIIGVAIDKARDDDDVTLNTRALAWCEELDARPLSGGHAVMRDYFRSNALAFAGARRRSEEDSAWEWDQEELQKQIYYLRRATRCQEYEQADLLLQCQILTNLAGALSHCGRFVEASAVWTEALRKNPKFWMARGNRGSSLMDYARAHNDGPHEPIFMWFAHRELEQMLSDMDEEPTLGDQGLRSHFASKIDHIERHYKLEAIDEAFSLDASGSNLNVGDEYRHWCLFSGLYLNTLNDIAPIELATHDDLDLPSMVTKLGKAPVVVGFFNQLKQEFVSARWLYFEAVNSDEVHDSDLGVYLYNTLDYPAYGLAVEKLKISFRMAYSILDKIAYFLNQYLDLGIAKNKVSFRGIWKEEKSSTVRPEFNASKNWPLRGLYWLSKDLFEPEFADVTDPDAQGLSKLRNHLEHKYVKVQSFAIPNPDTSDMWFDDFAYSLTIDELERRTLRLLRLVRAALIYLILGMHAEERRRHDELPTDALLGAFDLIPFEDERKRRN
ncbi:MAG: hypothetical protein EPN73_01565 [Paraburkholderia sp.]|uniref:LA2681 family HEPN domain-containing protein n=1 Tax=Paraburkholderia sp. TaxID=1926495 RepID=UPI0012190AAA|nr:LA2681 family HEPN domain-containing protein [Paraburkholderia sp.]TAL98641.1 MAG: hypothetical protein EPN73_01565 [Paraburkholderia sp.]